MFNRLELLIGKDFLDKIKSKRILIIGLGGVGSYALETLIRSGVSDVIIIDGDKIDESNLNRQLMSLKSNIGKNKTDIWEDRIKDINPNVKVLKYNLFIDKNNIDMLFENKIDYVIDCCDTIETKFYLIKYCLLNNIKFISSMGMANKMDIYKIKQTDLSKTSYDPVAKKLRYLVKKNNIKGKIPVVSSIESPKKCKNLGSISTVVAKAGICITDYIIKDIIGDV